MENYTAYILDQSSRDVLEKRFPPKYPKFIGHHVTYQGGVKKDAAPPPPAQLRVVGYVDSGDGLEALVVSVSGSTTRSDGLMYHITWSLDPTKYSPVNSNDVLKAKRFTIIRSIAINATPELL